MLCPSGNKPQPGINMVLWSFGVIGGDRTLTYSVTARRAEPLHHDHHHKQAPPMLYQLKCRPSLVCAGAIGCLDHAPFIWASLQFSVVILRRFCLALTDLTRVHSPAMRSSKQDWQGCPATIQDEQFWRLSCCLLHHTPNILVGLVGIEPTLYRLSTDCFPIKLQAIICWWNTRESHPPG